jgi:hypothetical protein
MATRTGCVAAKRGAAKITSATASDLGAGSKLCRETSSASGTAIFEIAPLSR